MSVRTRTIPFAIGVLLLPILASLSYGYDYFGAAELEREIEARKGQKVMVVDTLVRIWKDQDVNGYLRFDTERFRCAVPNTQTEAIAYLRELAKKREEGDRTPALVALFATVERAPLWGEVKGGQEDGVESEQILLICDRVEQPRGRFFEEGH